MVIASFINPLHREKTFMKVAEIRSRFLKFFEKQGHTAVPSSPLIPHNDPTLLFTNAGMVQFKDVFTGKEQRAYKRATSVQKCVRAGGKHNDLENVGFTARHHTFFEMLGNFSFGDYFKEDAIKYAWQFVTEELRLPKERLYASVHINDDEAEQLWIKLTPLTKERIYRFDKDNFWSMGDTGPCGPCSEIFVDRGKQYGCGKPDCAVGCECDRFMEIWNLVFMQFERDESGTMTPLPRPSVDTGAGLERIASVLQDAETNYDTDIFLEILNKTAALLGKKYDSKAADRVAYRVIADHSRATAFLISDGVMPANEGRGYVLRRIIRRAVRYGKNLGFAEPFLYKTCGFVIDQMKEAYPDLEQSRKIIEKVVFNEEEQFLRTLERGLALLDEEMEQAHHKGRLSGEVAFKLYDTYGFPLDLTRLILREKGLAVDEEGFNECMNQQKEKSRRSWKGDLAAGDDALYPILTAELREKGLLPKFVGYTTTSASGRLLKLLVQQGKEISETSGFAAAAGDESTLLYLIFDQTPFYGESGGQVGDKGLVTGGGFRGEVIDTQKPTSELFVLTVKPLEGSIEVGASYEQQVDRSLRNLTARNHTATHLLHWALREVLGKHVKQGGSYVTPELLRFDFSHFAALTPAELQQVEDLVNSRIFDSSQVVKMEMEKEEAIAKGAIAFFGEKYGDKVRVISVGDFSTELCGGTHIDDTAEINLFKIISETSIAAGVRRITAYTSQQAFQYLSARDNEFKGVKEKLKAATASDVEDKIEKFFATEKQLRRDIDTLRSQIMSGEVDALILKAETIGTGTTMIVSAVEADETGVKKLRDVAEKIKQKQPNSVLVLGLEDARESKAFLLAAVGKEAPQTLKANEIIAALAPMIEGRGGGKADMAQAGGTKLAGMKAALKEASGVIHNMAQA
jgi:alanyl-tRNA synthetase